MATPAPVDAAKGIGHLTTGKVEGAEAPPGVPAPRRANHPGLQVELALSGRNENLLRREADLAARVMRSTRAGPVRWPAMHEQPRGSARMRLMFEHRATHPPCRFAA